MTFDLFGVREAALADAFWFSLAGGAHNRYRALAELFRFFESLFFARVVIRFSLGPAPSARVFHDAALQFVAALSYLHMC